MSGDPPTDLTYPRAGSTTIKSLVPRIMTGLVRRYRALPPRLEGTAREAAHLATAELRGAGAASLGAALMAPTCSALLPGAERGDAGLSAALDLLVLVELATESVLSAPVRVPRPAGGWPRLPSITSGVAFDLADDVAWIELGHGELRTSGGESTELTTPRSVAGLSVSRAYVPITDDVSLALTDNNPRTSVKLHPERDDNSLDLGGHEVGEWVAQLREAFAIVAAHLPALYEEMRWLLRIVVPVGFHEERHSSCSYEAAIGAMYLTLHPRPIKLAEAIVHEYQHNKLHAVMRLDPLLRNGRRGTHLSPLRPDARPLDGVLLAVHAFLPVARMYRSITAAGDPLVLSHDWAKTCAAAEAIHRDGFETLRAHARPTKLGDALLLEMERLSAAASG